MQCMHASCVRACVRRVLSRDNNWTHAFVLVCVLLEDVKVTQLVRKRPRHPHHCGHGECTRLGHVVANLREFGRHGVHDGIGRDLRRGSPSVSRDESLLEVIEQVPVHVVLCTLDLAKREVVTGLFRGEGGFHISWTDNTDRNVVLCEFQPETVAHTLHRKFSAMIHALEGATHCSCYAADVDDAPLRSTEGWEEGLAHSVDPKHVHIIRTLHLGNRLVFDWETRRDPSIVDDGNQGEIFLGDFGADACGSRLHALVVCDIEHHRPDGSSFGQKRLLVLLLADPSIDGEPQCIQPKSSVATDPRAAARDDDGAFVVHFSFLF
mmetsp:Transcript_31122/g.60929  ORF Transcript_31122/g.60929 Transcript_31122/m.60929 type:complete len:322 (+) Transcript_31122:78-1043(+)